MFDDFKEKKEKEIQELNETLETNMTAMREKIRVIVVFTTVDIFFLHMTYLYIVCTLT